MFNYSWRLPANTCQLLSCHVGGHDTLDTVLPFLKQGTFNIEAINACDFLNFAALVRVADGAKQITSQMERR